MLQLRTRGLAKAVGVCNFSTEHLAALARTGREMPEVLQVKLHLANQQRDLSHFCRQHHIALMAATPLARGQLARSERGSRAAPLAPALIELAELKQRTAAEVAIRWCLQQGYVCIPKSKSLQRLESNAPFGLRLSEEEMKLLGSLDMSFTASSGSAALAMPWAEAFGEVSEVSDGDVGEEVRRRRRRRRRKGKGPGKGAKGKATAKGAAPAGGSAQRAAQALFNLT
ncbi:unnamed protein product [Durusdinium trenchii]|uniref:NADP-dependent oxidoreductase domain-containing protein n=1 Tax=Durusdinium trenchii TaxID=1381693 RepID=A0ABP0REX0_9DINO